MTQSSGIPPVSIRLAGKSTVIRHGLQPFQAWIHASLASDGSDLVQLRLPDSLAFLAACHVFDPVCRAEPQAEPLMALRQWLDRVAYPPGTMPAVVLSRISSARASAKWDAGWLDCPVALYFSGFSHPVIAVNLPFVDGAATRSEWREVIIVRQDQIPALLELVAAADSRPRTMAVIGQGDVKLSTTAWEDLVLEESVAQLIRRDFDRFLQSEAWYKQHRLPFRRGYLLHGPPGNGKTSVIRAMLSTPGLAAFTLNPFHPYIDEDLLQMLFTRAARSTPALIVLEDLDRCYPRNAGHEPASKLPLQQLLNHLDGVGSQDGMIVAATANNPAILDPAILRRPGRFDRVIEFRNPTATLRKRYIVQMHPPLANLDLSAFLRATDNFSFAQLREIYILAWQLAFEQNSELSTENLTEAINTLSQSMTSADHGWNTRAGFRDRS